MHIGLRAAKSIHASLAAAASRLSRRGRAPEPGLEQRMAEAAAVEANAKAGGAEGTPTPLQGTQQEKPPESGGAVAVEFVPITLVCRNLR